MEIIQIQNEYDLVGLSKEEMLILKNMFIELLSIHGMNNKQAQQLLDAVGLDKDQIEIVRSIVNSRCEFAKRFLEHLPNELSFD